MYPLTEEQSQFAQEHHALVYAFLRRKQLNPQEYYDEVILAYLRAAQQYLTREDLRRYRFSTISFHAMDWALKRYWHQAYARPVPMELDGLCGGYDPCESVLNRLERREWLDRLPLVYARILQLVEQGYGREEIAQMLSLPPRRVLMALYALYDEAHEEEKQRRIQGRQLRLFGRGGVRIGRVTTWPYPARRKWKQCA